MLSSQISEFQEKHRRRLLAFYGEKVTPVSGPQGARWLCYPILAWATGWCLSANAQTAARFLSEVSHAATWGPNCGFTSTLGISTDP